MLSWFASMRTSEGEQPLPPDLEFLQRALRHDFIGEYAAEDGQGIRLAQGPSTWFWGVALA